MPRKTRVTGFLCSFKNQKELGISIKKIPREEMLGKANVSNVSWKKLGKFVLLLITIKVEADGGILAACLVSVIFLVLGIPAFYQAKVYYTLCDLVRGM